MKIFSTHYVGVSQPCLLRALLTIWLFASQLPGCGGRSPEPAPPPPPPSGAPSKPSPSAKAPPARTPSTKVPEEPDAPSLPYEAKATEVTEGQAYDVARRRLLGALLDDESLLQSDPFSDRLVQSVHRRAENPYRKTSTPEGMTVWIGLTEKQILPTLERIAEASSGVEFKDVPSALRQALLDVRTARLRRSICKRRMTIADKQECSIRQTIPAEKILVHLIEEIQLLPLYRDGIPTHQGRFLRPLVVHARLEQLGRPVPLPGLPVKLTVGQDDPVEASFDPSGKLSHPLKDVPIDTSLRLQVDLSRLLGISLEGVEAPSLKTQGRPTSIARSVISYDQRSQAAATTAPEVRRGIEELITKRPRLDREDMDFLDRLSPHRWKKKLPALADRYEGALDRVIFLKAESEFASRMGTHRVWFEARGTLTVVNAWTGKVILKAQGVTTESGVGEHRAEAASRRALGRDLSDKLKQKLKRIKAGE